MESNRYQNACQIRCQIFVGLFLSLQDISLSKTIYCVKYIITISNAAIDGVIQTLHGVLARLPRFLVVLFFTQRRCAVADERHLNARRAQCPNC